MRHRPVGAPDLRERRGGGPRGRGRRGLPAGRAAPEVVAAGVSEGDTLVLTRDAGAEGGAPTASSTTSGTCRSSSWRSRSPSSSGWWRGFAGWRRWSGSRSPSSSCSSSCCPGLLPEESPTLVSLVGSAAIMFVVLYLAHGFSARTTTALVGTLFGLTLVAVLGSVAVSVARLTGLTSEETVTAAGVRPDPGLLGARAGRHRRGRARRAQRRHDHPGVGDLAAARGVAGHHLAGALQPRDDGRPRPHRLDRLHDRLRLRGGRAAGCCCSSSCPRGRCGRRSPVRRWPRRSSAPWSARSPWCSPCR